MNDKLHLFSALYGQSWSSEKHRQFDGQSANIGIAESQHRRRLLCARVGFLQT